MLSAKMPPDSVRGRIRRFLETHSSKLGSEVLEIGSRMHRPACWWIDNRDLAQGRWTGLDFQEGHNVDIVADIHQLPAYMTGKFTGVLCSEVLEHVKRPWVALPEIRRVMSPGGCLVLTTLTAFHIHGFPDDYYRYTAQGIRTLLEDAGFINIHTEYQGEIATSFKDHDQRVTPVKIPVHIFAYAYTPNDDGGTA